MPGTHGMRPATVVAEHLGRGLGLRAPVGGDRRVELLHQDRAAVLSSSTRDRSFRSTRKLKATTPLAAPRMLHPSVSMRTLSVPPTSPRSEVVDQELDA